MCWPRERLSAPHGKAVTARRMVAVRDDKAHVRVVHGGSGGHAKWRPVDVRRNTFGG